jgi:hypothetical protein
VARVLDEKAWNLLGNRFRIALEARKSPESAVQCRRTAPQLFPLWLLCSSDNPHRMPPASVSPSGSGRDVAAAYAQKRGVSLHKPFG